MRPRRNKMLLMKKKDLSYIDVKEMSEECEKEWREIRECYRRYRKKKRSYLRAYDQYMRSLSK